ncbi:TIM21-domain-containing protein [Spinellus fusiger]|nr:TIM21-domain-containing protein [Spinellus fusiger]
MFASRLLRSPVSRSCARVRCYVNPAQPKQRTTAELIAAQNTPRAWNELTRPQKVVAASKTSFNVLLLSVGAALTLGAVYYVTSELLSSQSPTAIFREAVERAKANSSLVALLGEPIQSYGTPSSNARRRNRRIHYRLAEDAYGEPHMLMVFHMEGSLSQGTGRVDMVKNDKDQWEFKSLVVDVPGQGLPSRRFVIV